MSTIVVDKTLKSITKHIKSFREHIFKDKIKFTTKEELMKDGFEELFTSFGDRDEDSEISLVYLYIFITSEYYLPNFDNEQYQSLIDNGIIKRSSIWSNYENYRELYKNYLEFYGIYERLSYDTYRVYSISNFNRIENNPDYEEEEKEELINMYKTSIKRILMFLLSDENNIYFVGVYGILILQLMVLRFKEKLNFDEETIKMLNDINKYNVSEDELKLTLHCLISIGDTYFEYTNNLYKDMINIILNEYTCGSEQHSCKYDIDIPTSITTRHQLIYFLTESCRKQYPNLFKKAVSFVEKYGIPGRSRIKSYVFEKLLNMEYGITDIEYYKILYQNGSFGYYSDVSNFKVSREICVLIFTKEKEEFEEFFIEYLQTPFRKLLMIKDTERRRHRRGDLREVEGEIIDVNVLNSVTKFYMDKFNIQMTFELYITVQSKIPIIKQYFNKITKESILNFLNRSEPTLEEIEEWRELYRQQEPQAEDYEIPPPPMWWLTGRSADVHTKRHIKIADCRIKKMNEDYPMKIDILKVADEIESETRRLAVKQATEDKLDFESREEYIEENTVKKTLVLKCYISETEPRWYGYGGIYDNDDAFALPDDKKVQLCDVLTKVWMVIKNVKDKESYETLLTQLVGIFKEHIGKGVCNQGWIGSMTSVFGSLAKEVGYLCLSEREQEIEDLVQKFLIDMRDDVEVKYPTINRQFIEISNILLDAKYDDEWDEKSHTPEENEKFYEKVRMYDVLYEDPTVSLKEKKETMIKFVDSMLPSFFMEVYASEMFKNEDILRVKNAVKKAIEEFKQFQVEKICGNRK